MKKQTKQPKQRDTPAAKTGETKQRPKDLPAEGRGDRVKGGTGRWG